ncbi:glycerophosphoryl diester phosphodiesterase [Gracilibacillus boraciitolerans JCM 21714]|uniref:Glycerophosphoryl diester phosphodiesterase n=1 Tax=Gracilibacillus boraciitolerans JCM 21714 TaxID=1298598 RepID=W4VEP9_9BACI|nr:glycerophosphodiester phosphodiesterase family protein [Gracilibacillus boraciitolerans]GAE91288.1 glycerophosphoryl diester phosphodiesterase [Gracilibacillus boraciitolerans JCM 21714]
MSIIIYAHRGASKQAPENTMAAFDLAYDQGANGIETDVQLTKDGIPVLIHDETADRTTNGTGYIKDLTYQELQSLDAGSWKSPVYSDSKIPALDELLAWNKDKDLKLNIELKNNLISYPDIEEIVCEKLQQHKMVEHTVISSFNHTSIAKLDKMKTTIDYALLTSKQMKNLIPFSKEINAKGIHIRYRLLSYRLVENATKNNLYVAVYTVNHPILIAKVLRLGCHALITDVPNLAVKLKQQTK